MFPNYASWWMKTPGRGYKTPTKINNNNRGAARSEADVANSPARRPGKVAPIFLAVSLPDRGAAVINELFTETIKAKEFGFGMHILEVPAQLKFISAGCQAYSNLTFERSNGF